MLRPLRILMLGGTGFTGPHQVRYALECGHTVTLFNRGRRPKSWPGQVEELTGDREVSDLKALAGREWDVCIDNATNVPSWVRDVGSVLHGKIAHYIFISTISVFADTSLPDMDESAPLARYEGPDAMAETNAAVRADMALYGPIKAASEAEAERQFPVRTTVIRPTLIVGPGDETDRFTYWPVRLALGGEVLAPPAEDPVQLIDARDLAEWTIRVAEQRTLGVFNATGPGQELRMGALLAAVQTATGSRAKLNHADAGFLDQQNIAAWQELPSWVPEQGETAGFARLSNARAVSAGLTFRPITVTAADTLEWFLTLPAERQAKLRAGLSGEREAAALRVWRERTG